MSKIVNILLRKTGLRDEISNCDLQECDAEMSIARQRRLNLRHGIAVLRKFN
jgi:hypothetical protein